MLKLSEGHVRLGRQAADKTEAIRQVGQVLVECGFVEPGYIDSMLGREQVANTYLGYGIAIPHGTPDARALVRDTGVAVVQFPKGVSWGGGGKVHVAVGIAAKSDEHLQVLANLTGVLADADAARRLATTGDPNDVAATLNGEPVGNGETAGLAATGAKPGTAPDAVVIAVTSPSPLGLHARPATALVEVAKRFQADIQVVFDAKAANAKSLVSLLRLGAVGGSRLKVLAQGRDAVGALEAIAAAFAEGLGEGDLQTSQPAAPPLPAAPSPSDLPSFYEGRVIAGLAASPGIAIGPVWAYRREELRVAERAPDPVAQHHRLDQALAGAAADLHNLHEEFERKAGTAKAGIFKAHLELLEDPDLVAAAHRVIDDGHDAGWAWRSVYEDQAASLGALKDPLLAGRAADLRDVGRRVLRRLADVVGGPAGLTDHPVILVADDLSPSDTAGLDPRRVLGLCTAGGGATSHTAIIARSLDIPAMVAAGPAAEDLPDGTQAILDGDAGVLIIDPSPRDRRAAEARRVHAGERRETERHDRYLPAITRDGRRIEVVANIGGPGEAAQAVEAGGEGVGLTRTEFLFLQRAQPPGEDEQFAIYRAMVRDLNGLPLILRTLDIGGDKNVPYLRLPAESNPFLGVRGIRLCLARPDLFRTQLRAVFRAARDGPVKLMYPMIATLDELAEAKAITEAVRREIGADPIDIGIMIEVPAAAMMADQLAREVDFFSIGTNDLTQYVLAMDRLHPGLAPQADGLHPAVLRTIERTVAGAREAGIWVGACGGIAGDPAGTVVLAGLGVTELSVSIPSIAATKARLRTLAMADAEDIARRALTCRDGAAVRALVREILPGPGEAP